ncbi:MAG: anti-sigma factor [Actinomycetota bacterium]|nr:anti-sigma factor [Actinomycetota bacterium]MDA8210007.1 anti-sigma factor [Actinomycetota bacterium]
MNTLEGHARLSELVPVYAVGALEGEELRALEEHLDECPLCRAELRELSEVIAEAVVEPVEPPSSVLAAVLAETGGTAANPEPAGADIRELRPRRGMPGLVAALLALVLGVGSLSFWLGRSTAPAGLSASGGKVVYVQLTGSSGSFLRLELQGTQALVSSSDLPRLPQGRTYQVWGLPSQDPSGAPVSLGLAGGDPQGARFTLPDISRYRALAVTAEPAGGTAAPTSSPVVSGAVRPA